MFRISSITYPRNMTREQYKQRRHWERSVSRKVNEALDNPSFEDALKQQMADLAVYGQSAVYYPSFISKDNPPRVCGCVMGHSAACRILYPGSINETEARHA